MAEERKVHMSLPTKDRAFEKVDSALPVAYARQDFIRKNNRKLEDEYELEAASIGEGAFGKVFKAVHKTTRQLRAIKRIPKKVVSDVELLKVEIEIMMELDHPNVIKLVEYFEDEETISLALELCTGGELFDRIIEKKMYSEQEAAKAISQMLHAVLYCHKKNIMHRDLKPENFLYRTKEEDTLKLIDFGLSDRFSQGQYKTTRAGTVWYMSPEMLVGKYTEAADVWSLGVILYIILCGYPPFSNDERKAIRQIRKGDWSFDPNDWANVSLDAKMLIKKMMEQDETKRVTAEQALKDPWIIKHGGATGTTRAGQLPVSVVESFKKFRREERLKRAAMGLIAQVVTEDEPMVRRMREVFLEIDADGDGLLSSEEIKAGMKKLGIQLNDETFTKLMRGVDVNRSGRIDWTEFLAANLDYDLYAKEELCRAAFQMFDTEGTGHISAVSLQKVLGGSLQEQTEEDYAKMISEVDINKDGTIDYPEFLAMMRKKRKASMLVMASGAMHRPSQFLKSLPESLVNQSIAEGNDSDQDSDDDSDASPHGQPAAAPRVNRVAPPAPKGILKGV